MPTTIRNGKLFCTKCGEEKIIPYPIGFKEVTELRNEFQEAHKECLQTWKQPIADPNTSIEERMEFWLNKGERGASSEVMFEQLSGKSLERDGVSHPTDSGDFGRCYALLETIPEWHNELYKMKEISPVWNSLVCNWDVLTEMYLDQLGKKQDGGMGRYMRKIISDAEQIK